MKKNTFKTPSFCVLINLEFTSKFFKLTLVFLFAFLWNQSVFSQIFTEDFEAASTTAPVQADHELSTAAYLNWESGRFTNNTNNNYWWILDDTYCDVISGDYSLAVSQNTLATTGVLPQYDMGRRAFTSGSYNQLIDATNYTNVTLDFKYIAGGETGNDYGNVIYSFDGLNWAALPGNYLNQPTQQQVTGLDLSVIDGQQFYIGFSWINDNRDGTNPGFIVDDIVINGTLINTCSTPNAPILPLNLSPTNDTISGTFTAASPVPSGYLVVVSTSNTAPNPTNGTAYNIGDTIGAGYTVVDNDADTAFTATGLSPNTIYYIYIFSYNAGCLGEPIFSLASLSNSTTTTNSTYCIPQTTTSTTLYYINDVEFIGTLNDVPNLNNGTSSTSIGYSDYTSSVANSVQAQGEGVNVYVGSNAYNGHWKAWIDWNKDGQFDNNPANGELVYDTGGIATTTTTFGFVIPSAQAIGDYRIRIRFYNTNQTGGYAYNFNSCETFNRSGALREYGEAEDYLFTVVSSCPAKITSITDGEICGPGTVDLTVTGTANVTEYFWYASETGGSPIATTSSGMWSPTIAQTTTYWVTASNGSCESLVRSKIIATLNPVSELTINAANDICGENNIIEISASGDLELAYLIDEDFESGLGVFSSVNYDLNGAAIDNLSEWQIQSSTYVPANFVWYPAISSGFGTNQFATSTSDVNPSYYIENSLESISVDTSTFTDLFLDFDIYFSRYLYDNTNAGVLEFVYIDVSTDGGTNWTNIQVYDNDIGYGTNFESRSLNLSAYIDEPNFKVQVYYFAAWCDGVAIDNIQLYGTRPLTPSFTWTSATTINAYTQATALPGEEYIAGTAYTGSIYIKPSIAQLENEDFTFTANATLDNGCVISKEITVANKTKVWQGLSSDWNDPNNWKPQSSPVNISDVPDDTNCVIIPDEAIDPIITSGINADAFSLSVKDDAKLTINPGASLTVVDIVNIDALGEILLESINGAADGSSSSVSGSLIQVDDSAINTGTGKLTLNRNTFVRNRDYVYWSSPVANFSVTSILNTPNIFKWNPTIFVNSSTQYGNWVATAENMVTAKGYIVRGGPSGNGTNDTAAWNTASFEGIPNNGLITIPILRGTCIGNGCGGTGNGGTSGTDFTEDDDNWNLVGNPYPSALSANDFLEENSDLNSRIDGTVYLWTHGTKIRRGNSPFFGEFVFNYDIDDYTEYNYTGSTGGFNGFIGSGQGFFVLMDDASASGTDLVFNNGMRDRTYESGVQFFRNSNQSRENRERHRIWLDLIPPSYNVSTSLLGYVEGASNSKDKLFDAQFMSGSTKKLYTIIDGSDKRYSIQGRSLPFEETDIVPLGIIIDEEGEYAINIQAVDGLFESENQDVFIEDLELGIVHNLKESPYFFTPTGMGEFVNRFQIRFTSTSLGIDEFNTLTGLTISAPNSDYIKISSTNETIDSVVVFDLLGRNLLTQNNVNSNELILDKVSQSDGVLLVKVTLTNGQQKIQKVVLRH